ncbi:MAG: iron uptake porin [Microcoleus vaginatus WJT46-NPBG5]|jgi:BMFP domain-containing protein YqiC|nr:iron uptake porin [Microcoleus vaginatus WJT46-NPBG5]
MHKVLWRLLLISPAILISVLGVSMATIAEESPKKLQILNSQIKSENSEIEPAVIEEMPASKKPLNIDSPQIETAETAVENQEMEQVTSVSQLSDVQPTDWAFQALQNLVERYGCIAGYPDGTFRGNRAITRYEFAAGLNACLEAITQLIQPGGDFVTQEDLAILNRLLTEFQGELATLRGRIDALEARTSELEANQFSTTTKLVGEVVFAASDIIGEIDTGRNAVPTLSERVRLNFITSFTGKDSLLVRLYASNSPNLGAAAGTNMARLHPDRGNGNNFDIDLGWYNFPLGDKGNVLIEFAGGKLDDFAPSLNALDYGGAALGTISQFGQRNPIYRLSGAGVGAGATYNFSKRLGVSLGYLAGNYLSGGDPSPKRGFFNGTFGAIAQLTVQPTENIGLGLTYVRSYFTGEDVANNNVSTAGGVGSSLAEKPFGDVATSLDSYGVEATWRLSPRLVLGGWVGWTEATAQNNAFSNGVRVANRGDEATILNWALTLAFPDLGKEGSLGGIVVGMPPKITNSDVAEDRDSSLHLEAFYRYQITDNIGITPGLMVILDPEHNNENKTMYVGTLRTTFTF